MSVPYELKIVPALTFRPLSPVLAHQIASAYRDLANETVRPADPAPVVSTARLNPSEPATTLDRRT